MVEVLAINKIVDLIKNHSWLRVNILSDSLSLLETLKNLETILFPNALNNCNIIIIELIYKISRLNIGGCTIRFTWCPTHVGIENNKEK